jgi:hypothetical protein
MRTKEIYAGVGVLALGGISLVSSLDNGKATTPVSLVSLRSPIFLLFSFPADGMAKLESLWC